MAKHYHAMGILDITKRVGDPTAVKSIQQVAAENDELRHANAALREALRNLASACVNYTPSEYEAAKWPTVIAAFAAIAAAEGTA